MPTHTIKVWTPVVQTARVMQLNGIFDVPPSARSERTWDVHLDLPDDWSIGVIVGPSGSGKSTIARELFADALVPSWDWPEDKSILDGFPGAMSIKDIVALLSSVGFSSPPSWVRPYHVLSTGEQFRVTMARTLAEMTGLAVVDEFTSVIDRTVAQVGSAAIARTVRSRGQQLIAVTCHYDVLDWLEPDWVYQPHVDELSRGYLWQKPPIELVIRRVHRDAWRVFRHHHYLDTALNPTSRCFVAFWRDRPVAFAATIPMPHPRVKHMWRGHRTVCLPDFQGVGIGNALSDYVAGVVRGIGGRYVSTTGHPAMIERRNRSAYWKMTRSPGLVGRAGNTSTASVGRDFSTSRLTASFEYVGPAVESSLARRLWGAL